MVLIIFLTLDGRTAHIIVHVSLGIASRLEVLLFQLIMLDELIGTTVVGVPFVEDVLADLVKRFCDV